MAAASAALPPRHHPIVDPQPARAPRRIQDRRALGRRRNDQVEPELHLPAARLVSRAATLRLFPGIRAEGLTGGAQWYDYQIVESDRLSFAFAEAADRSGADLANYVEAVAAVRSGDRITGMEMRDALSGRQLSVQARATINAAGRRIPDVMALFGDPRQVPMLKAMNLVTAVPARDMALAAPTAAGRMLTLVPWLGRALVGTSQSQLVPPGAQPTVTEAEVQAFIDEANSAFPALRLARDQVTLVHRGIVPAAVDGRGRAELLSHANPIDHGAAGARGAFSVLGLKYTTARGVAERTIDLVARQLGARLAPSRTASRPLPGAAIADHEALAIETARSLHVDVPLGTLRHLSARYAERAADIVRLMKDSDDWCQPVAPGLPTIGAEVIHAIRYEAAHHLTDIVIRRSGLGAGGHPGGPAVAACGYLAAQELGWDSERLDQEVALVDRFYQVEP